MSHLYFGIMIRVLAAVFGLVIGDAVSQIAPIQEVKRATRTSGEIIDARCTQVTDGDSIVVEIPGLEKPWSPIVVRIRGIDTPELKDERPEMAAKAKAAKARMAELCSGPVTLVTVRRDKYFRLLATVMCRKQDVGAIMLKEGYAKPYKGVGPKPW